MQSRSARRVAALAANDGAATSFEDLVALAERHSQTPDGLRAAADAYRRALQLRPGDCRALDGLGELLIFLDEPAEAIAVLQRSAELDPASGYAKWMYLGQLSSGAEAAAFFTRGLQLIQQRLAAAAASGSGGEGGGAGAVQQQPQQQQQPEEPAALLRRRLSEAYCSLTELYLTDLCDEEDAEAKSGSFSASALSADDSNPEAHQVRARWCLVLKRDEEARVHLARCCALIEALEGPEEGEGGEEEEGAAGGMDVAEGGGGAPPPPQPSQLTDPPSFDFRLETARVCMEAELYPQASALLNALLGEDDTNMEVWFMAGEAALLEGDSAYACEVLATADAMLSAALSAQGGKGSSKAAAMSAAAAASAGSSMDFSAEAIAALLNTAPSSLAEQQGMIRSLLGKAREAAAAAEGGGGAGAGGGGGGGGGGGSMEQ